MNDVPADGTRPADTSLSLAGRDADRPPLLKVAHLRHRDTELVSGGDDIAWLTLVLSDKQIVERNTRGVWSRRPSKVGVVTVTNPDELTRITIRGEAKVARLFVPISNLADVFGINQRPNVKARFNEQEPRLERCVQRALVAWHQGNHMDPLLSSSIALVLSNAIIESPFQGDSRAAGGLSRRQLRRVEELIESRSSAPVASSPSLSELAAEAGLSVHHFAREFRRTTGATPYAYTLRRRLDRARALVVGSRTPLAQIGTVSGFPSAAHFSERFHREMGVTPGALRRATQA